MPEPPITYNEPEGLDDLPIDAEGAEEEIDELGEEAIEAAEDAAEEMVSDQAEVLPADPRAAKGAITKEQHDHLESWLQQTVEIYWTSMRQRIERWREIHDAYMLIPDAKRMGLTPEQARLVSEHTRGQVNNASARLAEGLLGTRPWVDVQVISSGGQDDPETMELLEDAKAIVDLFDDYMEEEIRAEEVVPLLTTMVCKGGNGPVKVYWTEKNRDYSYLKADRKEIGKKRSRYGTITWELIPVDDFIAWPLWEVHTDELELVGHRSRMSVAEWRAWAKGRGIESEIIDQVAQGASEEPDESTRKRLEASEIRGASLAHPGQVEFYELWANTYLLGDDEPRKLQLFYSHEIQKLLYAGKMTIRCGRHPYFRIPYWLDDLCFFASGVGHETLFAQAADSALLNMLIDNLKVVGNMIRLVKQNSGAEIMSNEIGPGVTIATEDPEGDFRVVSLGESLGLIYEAMQNIDSRKMHATGITNPAMGLADPVLKSGASPGHYQMLLAEAGKKFGQVDRHMRSEFSRMYAYMLELFQQYAPDGLIDIVSSQKNASVLKRIKRKVPAGDLSAKFRILARAPSAASNRETLKQHLVLVYQMAIEHVKLISELGAQVWQQANPARMLTYAEEAVNFLSWVFKYIIELNDIPGAEQRMPKTDEPPAIEEEIINNLQQQLEQYGQAYEKASQELEALRAQQQEQEQAAMGMQPPAAPAAPAAPEPPMPPGPMGPMGPMQ